MDRLPAFRLWIAIREKIESSAWARLYPAHGPRVDFSRPLGEEALFSADSVSWRIFKNPVSVLIGGIAAVILELAEPGVRAGVWGHSNFRGNPMRRLQRTGLAAMVTVYGARSISEPMIARVVGRHSRVSGTMSDGRSYAASDVRLLNWVQATATYGFSRSYSRYVRFLSGSELDRAHRESLPAARLYGAHGAPASSAELEALFDSMRDTLEYSPVIFDFLCIMRTLPGLPWGLQWMQGIMVRAAVDILPTWLRERLGLSNRYALRSGERWLVLLLVAAAERLCLRDSPSTQACLRLGMPTRTWYAQPVANAARQRRRS